MTAIQQISNFVGGIPDLFTTRFPDFMLEKCGFSRDEYLQRIAFYRDRFLDRSERFLVLPDRAPEHEVMEERKFEDGVCRTISYPSRYPVQNPSVHEAFQRNPRNLTGYLHLWRHPGAEERPLVLCIHGFSMGHPAQARRMFRIKTLYRLGLDVALHTLPHHWRRARGVGLPRDIFRPHDLALALETWAQNIHDLHSANLLLRETGYRRIGAIGASLGGYTAALYAVFDAPLDFIFMTVPAADLSPQLMPRKSLFPFKLDAELLETSRQVLGLITPLHYRPAFDTANICVIAHQGDRICPIAHVRELVQGWSIPNYHEVIGGHWAYLDRDRRGRTWYGWLAQKGYIAPEAANASD